MSLTSKVKDHCPVLGPSCPLNKDHDFCSLMYMLSAAPIIFSKSAGLSAICQTEIVH